MAEQIKLTATLACWVSTEYSLRGFTDAVAKGNHMAALDCVHFYGPPEREKFSDSTKVGTAEITMTVVSRDELTTNAVKALKATARELAAKAGRDSGADQQVPGADVCASGKRKEPAMKPRIDVGGRQGRDERDGITTRNGGGSYEHGMPITFEGDEPQAATPWELMLAGARWVLLAFALVCTLMIAAGYYGA